MASSRVFASRLASQMAVKAARPAVRAPVAAASKRTISGKFLMRQKFFLGLN
jgi:F-type H+-transporting ATPase subunit c